MTGLEVAVDHACAVGLLQRLQHLVDDAQHVAPGPGAVAGAAGAEDSEVDAVAERLKREGKVRADLAEQFLKELREG